MIAQISLISMPWATPYSPCIQLGLLKSHMDAVFGDQIRTRCHSAHLGIRLLSPDATARAMPLDEHAYMLLVLGERERRHARGPTRLSSPLAGALEELTAGKPAGSKLTQRHLRELSRVTKAYFEAEVAPHLRVDRVNIIGFTVVYDQIYASIFAANYLRKRFPGFKLLFLFGGYSVTIPKVAEIFHTLRVPGLFVIGEGERKLEMIARTLVDMSDGEFADAEERIVAQVPGVLRITPMTPLFERKAECFSSQFDSLEEVPLPDYQEYFATLGKASADEEFRLRFLQQCQLPIEGSRGCFAACDFCGLNSTWAGFRAAPADRVVGQAEELSARHPGPTIFFVDNVCDTWAGPYAERLLERGLRYDAFMELRAHHPETFWTKLALAGVNNIQIGVESFSPGLLSKMGKGTRVFQNIAVQKYLKELGVNSCSNLIFWHPQSTLADVAETRRALEQLIHLDELSTIKFVLVAGSPLYYSLPLKDRQGLRPALKESIPAAVRRFAFRFGHIPPKRMALHPAIDRAWQELDDWYEGLKARCRSGAHQLTVARIAPDRLRILDSRFGELEEHFLTGADATIYDFCHSPHKEEHIAASLGLTAARVHEGLASLVQRQLLYETEGFYLSLALRPRDELIRRYYQNRQSSAAIISMTETNADEKNERQSIGTNGALASAR
jgi:radical SAM superfamily enzyme YgiQ (UPF0313 family)